MDPSVKQIKTISFLGVFICQKFHLFALLPQSVHKQQQLQHQEFQRQMEERLELLQRQQPFLSADIGLGLGQDSDYLEVVRARSESSDHSSPNVTPRASNHSNLSVPELGSSPYEREEGGNHSRARFSSLLPGFHSLMLLSIIRGRIHCCTSGKRIIPS